MSLLLKPVERLFAFLGLLVVVGIGALHQTSGGATTPCRALVVQARAHLPAASKEVVDACVGAKGEGGPVGLLVDLGLAVTGQSRDKLSRRVGERLEQELRARVHDDGELRCGIILVEGVVGRSNGGPRQYALDLADGHKAACRGEDSR